MRSYVRSVFISWWSSATPAGFEQITYGAKPWKSQRMITRPEV